MNSVTPTRQQLSQAIDELPSLLATVNNKDENHRRVLDVIGNLKEEPILPITVLPEVCYLIVSRLGHHKMIRFVR